MNTEQTPKWTSTAGPIQTKRVNKALSDISWEGRTTTTKSGVIGGEEHEYSSTVLFGASRPEAGEALKAIAEKFAYTVTRENCADIVAAAQAALVELRKSRVIVDERKTPEQKAASDEMMRQADERRRIARENAEELRKAAAVEANQVRTTSGIIVRKNEIHNGVEIQFPGKPSPDVIARCKAAGFRWSFHSKVWYKKFGAYAWAQAHTIAGLPLPGERDPGEAAAAVEQPDRFDMQVEDNMAAACGL